MIAIADACLWLTNSHRGLSGRNSIKTAIMIGHKSCIHTGKSQLRLFDKCREPRTAPLAMIAPAHLDVKMISFASSRSPNYIPKCLKQPSDYATICGMANLNNVYGTTESSELSAKSYEETTRHELL